MTACELHGMYAGCTVDCPVLLDGECEFQDSENKELYNEAMYGIPILFVPHMEGKLCICGRPLQVECSLNYWHCSDFQCLHTEQLTEDELIYVEVTARLIGG